VTNAINTAMVMMSMRQLQVAQGDVQGAVLEAPALDPETRSRLYQVSQLAKNASAAAARLLILTDELEHTLLGTAGPPNSEALSDAVAMEELKRQKQKESELASSLRQALHDSDRTQADLHRGLAFLMPQILLEDEDGVGLPGFQSPMENPADLDVGGLIWNSHAEFFAHVSALLDVLKTEWLAKYQDTLSKFLEFFQKFTDIMEQFKPEASGDKGDVAVNFIPLHGELKKLAEKYGLDANAFASFDSESGAMAFRDSLNLPGLKVTGPGEGGKYYVKMDVSAVDQLVESMERNGNVIPEGVVMDSAAYNAWVTQKDSNVEQIKYVSKVLGEKLNEMTQKYDNIVKILSSTIDRMTEANKSYVQNT